MTAALSSSSLGTVTLPRHPFAGGVSHGCSSSRGQPAAGNDTRRGTPRRPRQGRPGPAPAPGKGIPAAGDRARGPLPYRLRGRLSSENPLREPSLPHSPGPATSHAAHLWGCAPGSRGYTHAVCSAYKETNKVIEIETAPQASELGFLLKWLQGRRRGTASASGPAHRASCSAPALQLRPLPSLGRLPL